MGGPIADLLGRDVEVYAGNTERPPTRDDDFLVFAAQR